MWIQQCTLPSDVDSFKMCKEKTRVEIHTAHEPKSGAQLKRDKRPKVLAFVKIKVEKRLFFGIGLSNSRSQKSEDSREN